MGKRIIVDDKNGTNNIRKSRIATNDSNWEEDLDIWKLIQKINKDDPKLSKIVNKKGEVKFRFLKENGQKKNGELKYKNDSDVSDVITTLASKIANNNALEYGITYQDEVEFWMVLDMLDWLVGLPKKAQKFFCRNASRQSVDEDVQKATLEKYLTGASIDKPKNGVLTLVNGDIVKKPKKDKVEARSIDFVVNNGKEFNVFAKYSAVSGSGQTHQADESRRFIQEAIKYTDKHNDGKFFIALTDGAEGERHLTEMNELANGYSNIFAGNCENVIDFINSIK